MTGIKSNNPQLTGGEKDTLETLEGPLVPSRTIAHLGPTLVERMLHLASWVLG